MNVEPRTLNRKQAAAGIHLLQLVIRRSALTVYCSWFLVFLAGCGSSQLETAPVRGTITIDGKPLETGKVRFVPERGRGATGDIQPDGTYTLTTYSAGDGATVGKHRVSIVARAAGQKRAVESEEPLPPSLIPEHYADESKSGLDFEVRAGQDNQADFDLKSR
jgi:hypothetical protein